MKRRIATLLIAVSITLGACTAPVTTGRVIGKTYTPAHYASVYVPVYRTVCDYSGQHCSQRDESYYTQQWQPADYELQLQKGKHTGSVAVDAHTWDTTKVGSQWPPA